MNERDAYMLANALVDVWSSRKRRFHYATVSAESVLLAGRIDVRPDGYVTDDAETIAVRNLLAKSYRWIRADGSWAVFEKEIS